MELRITITTDQEFRDLGTLPARIAVPAMKKLAFDAYRKLMEKSPVDRGLFRGNWQLSISAAASGVLQRLAPNKGGLGPLASEQGKLSRYGADGKLPDIIIANNLPYASRLEAGWSKKQAPGGIVRPTIAELIGGMA